MSRDVASMLEDFAADTARLAAPADRPRPVVLPAYGAVRAGPNLTALVALMLKRFGVAVLVHGRTDVAAGGAPGVTTAEVLRELSIAPAATLAEAQAQLARESFAFVPADVLSPGLARRLRERDFAGGDGLAFAAAQAIDPFGGEGFRVVCATGDEAAARMREILASTRADALLVLSAGGEPFPDTARPRLEAFAGGVATAISDDGSTPVSLPTANAPATARWIRDVLEGAVPVPDAIVAEIGACLDGARRPRAAR